MARLNVLIEAFQFQDDRPALQQLCKYAGTTAFTAITGSATGLRTHAHPHTSVAATHNLHILFNHLICSDNTRHFICNGFDRDCRYLTNDGDLQITLFADVSIVGAQLTDT